MTARTTARRLSGFAASRSLTVASVGLPSGLVMVGSPSGVGDVRHHQPAMTACLRRFAEPSARYSKARQTDADASGTEGASKKPTASRSKTASADAQPSEVDQKPAATRSRQTPPA